MGVGDLHYNDFDTEVGVGRGLMDIVRVLIMTLIKSVLATIVGKENTKALADSARGSKENLQNTMRGSKNKLKKGLSGMFSRRSSASSSMSSTAEDSAEDSTDETSNEASKQ